jgi:fibronectin-binding autotransporter adhesin
MKTISVCESSGEATCRAERFSKRLITTACLLALFITAGTASAQTIQYWTSNVTGNLSNAVGLWTNASSSGTNPASGNAWDFSNGTGVTLTNNFTAGWLVAGISFDAGTGADIITGNSINLFGNIINNSPVLQTMNTALVLWGNDTVTNSGTGQIALGGVISGVYGLSVGGGTTTLTGSNTFTGGLTVTAGSLLLTNGGTLGATNGAVTANSGTTVDLGGQTMTNGAVALTGSTLQNGTISASGYTLNGATVTANLAGTGALANTGGTSTLSGSNSYTGTTTLSGGTLILQATSANTNASGVSSAMSTNSALVINQGTTLQLIGSNNTIFLPASLNEGTVTGTFTIVSSNSVAGATNTLGNFGQLGAASTAPTFNFTGTPGTTLAVGSGTNGAGVLNFYNSQTYNASSGLTVLMAGGLIPNYPLVYTNTFGGAGNFTLGSMIPTNTTYAPTLQENGTGTVTLATNATLTQLLGVTGVMNLSPGSTVTLTAGNNYVGYNNSSFTLNLNGATLNVPNGALLVAGNTGGIQTSTSVLNMGSGTINAVQLNVARGNSNSSSMTGTLNMTGGVINIGGSGSYWYVGSSGSTGTLNMGGTAIMNVGTNATLVNTPTVGWANTGAAILNISNSAALHMNYGNNLLMGEGATGVNATINQEGGTVTFYSDLATTVGGAGALNLDAVNAVTTSTNTYNLDGGILTVPSVKASVTNGTARVFNFGGGTLTAAGSSATFFNLGAGNGTANVRNGGAVINNNGFAITISQPLVHSTIAGDATNDGGLTASGAGTLTLTGVNTYTGPTTVSTGTLAITNGGTLGATNGAIILTSGTINLGGQTSTKGNFTMASGLLTNGTLAATSYVLIGGGTISANLTNGVAGASTLTMIRSWNG